MERQADLFGLPPGPRPTSAQASPPTERPPRHAIAGGLFGDATQSPGRSASERQASFASDISHGLGIPLPMEGDSLSIGDFITRHRKEYEDHFRRKRQRR